uniref:Methyltransferase FkbM family n=1 Tax=Cyanothece sp. (strain PCC 7425 / ATCC 29141) TaxID=395961 RepID=B8HV71_CYAP4
MGLKSLLNRFRNSTLTIEQGFGKGLKFSANLADSMFGIGTYEMPLQNTLAQYLQPGSVFYDIGANVGFFSIIAAQLVGDTGQVYAFEPVPENVATIRRNVELNQFANVRIFDQAISSSSGEAELLLAQHIGGASLATAATPPDLRGRMKVKTASIDDLLQSLSLKPPSLVKIDVEGAEIDVLHGMLQTIQTYQPVIIYEVDDGDFVAFQEKRQNIAKLMLSLNYQTMVMEKSYPEIQWHVEHAVAIPNKFVNITVP